MLEKKSFLKTIPLLKYLFALLLFGSNGIVASFIVLNSQKIVLFRTLIGSLFLLLIFLISGNKFTFWKHKKQFLFLVISGMTMGASWMFLYEAYTRIGVSISSLLYYCGPIIVIILSPFLFKERLTVNKVIGFILVFSGVILINENAFNGCGNIFGIVCGLLSAVMYAFMVICNKKATSIVGVENSTLQLLTAFFTVAIFVGIKQGYVIDVPTASILPIAILGVLNTGIGCFLYFSSIGQLKVQTVVICGYLEPLSAIVFSALILKEEMLPLQIFGAILIIGGAVICECKTKRDIIDA